MDIALKTERLHFDLKRKVSKSVIENLKDHTPILLQYLPLEDVSKKEWKSGFFSIRKEVILDEVHLRVTLAYTAGHVTFGHFVFKDFAMVCSGMFTAIIDSEIEEFYLRDDFSKIDLFSHFKLSEMDFKFKEKLCWDMDLTILVKEMEVKYFEKTNIVVSYMKDHIDLIKYEGAIHDLVLPLIYYNEEY